MFLRWIRFNSIGVLGAVIHFSTLALLNYVLGVHYLLATIIAIEAAIIHNFVWHQKWTWKDRPVKTIRGIGNRFMKFHLSNGFTSMIGNLVIMKALVGYLNLPVMVASVAAVLSCALINFFLSDLLVFRKEFGKVPGRVMD